jgi:amino acid transporter
MNSLHMDRVASISWSYLVSVASLIYLCSFCLAGLIVGAYYVSRARSLGTSSGWRLPWSPRAVIAALCGGIVALVAGVVVGFHGVHGQDVVVLLVLGVTSGVANATRATRR